LNHETAEVAHVGSDFSVEADSFFIVLIYPHYYGVRLHLVPAVTPKQIVRDKNKSEERRVPRRSFPTDFT
jgi:hypothetical protein